MFESLAVPAFILVALTAVGVLLSRDWRWLIALFALQYVGVFVLVGVSWPLGMAVIKLIVGWMCGAVLGMTEVNRPEEVREGVLASQVLFRALAAGLVVLVVFSVAPQMGAWLPRTPQAVILGGLTLIGIGLLHLGMTAHPLRVIIALLTVLAGFDVLYAAAELSLLVTGLLAGISLGLALVGAYFLTQSVPDASDEAARPEELI